MLENKKLIINGKEYLVSCEESDKLSDIIRATGLTGTKVGCDKGQCGACSVILDGKLVRSCTKRMKSINDGAEILTIEGVGTMDAPHALQLAWGIKGAVQCGFCSPGFIVAAKALLDQNPDPTREEVREWFQKNRNACRCTGYKPIVDAVMLAAAVMRGDRPEDDLHFRVPEDGKIYNTEYPRPAALGKACGVTDYGDDKAVKGDYLEAAIVLAKVPHANIKGIDTSEAEKAEGVVKVVTAKDIQGINRIVMPIGDPHSKCNGSEQPILCDTKVFRYGDPIAVVIADTRKHARAAAELVKPDYELLPGYENPLDAMADDAIEIHPGIPNVYYKFPVHKGTDTRKVIPDSEYAVEGSFYSTRQPHLPIEPDVNQAYIDEDGVLTIFNKSHLLPLPSLVASQGIGWPMDKFRVIMNPTGGAFGYSLSVSCSILVAVATIAVGGRPVNMTLSYEEHQHFTGKRAASYSNAKLACDKDGKLTGIEFEIAYDKGAYSEVSNVIEKGLQFYGAPYNIPNVMGVAKAVFSTNAYSTAYRGYGSPQAYTGSEALMDMLAEKIGMDPFEFRYINVMRDGDTGNLGHTYSVYPMSELMDMARPKYREMQERAKAADTPEKRRGVGVACGHYNVAPGPADHSEVAIELNPDGSVTHYSQWEDLGQGGDIGALVHTHQALRPLGLTPDQIHLVMNDTATCPMSGCSGGSRQHYMTGNAIVDSCNKLMDAMRKPDGTFRTYDEMVAEGIPTKYIGVHDTGGYTSALDPNTGQGNQGAEYTYCVFLADVEVDTATGKTKVLEMHTYADVGVVGNYLAVDGQAYGGMMHSIGFALSEDYSDVEKHKNLIGSGFPFIEDVPDDDKFTVTYLETPRPRGPQGSSGCSEGFQSGDHMAVINAIYNACGVRVYELPALPEKILEGLARLAEGKTIDPKHYYLGGDMYEELDEMWENPVVAAGGDLKF